MEVPRNPSVTPDEVISRSWSQRPLSSHLASSPALPALAPAPALRARAVPPPPPAHDSNVIDLTSDSPPPRTRALSQVSGADNPRQAKRQRVAEVPANSAAGSSRPARRPVATTSATVVIDSDSDDDIIVVEPTPSGSGSWGARVGAVASGSARPNADEVAAEPPLPRQRYLQTARRATGGIAPRHAHVPRSPPPYIVPPPAPNPSAARSYSSLAALRNLLPSSSRASSTSSSNYDRDRSANRSRNHEGAGDWGLEHLLAQNPGILEGMMDGAAALAGYYGYGGGGLQGVMGFGAKVVKGKKYGVRMSHPRKVDEGFSRDVIAPLEEGESRPQGRKGKGKKVDEMEPVCAGCLEPLLLAQSGERRPWALKCGHVVCGKCVGDAKMRCEGIKEEERKARWKMDVDRKDEVVFVDDDDEIDYVDEETVVVASKGKGKAKGKGKSRAGETGVEEAWTMCPVVGCDGAGTDLLAEEGDYAGAFELFV